MVGRGGGQSSVAEVKRHKLNFMIRAALCQAKREQEHTHSKTTVSLSHVGRRFSPSALLQGGEKVCLHIQAKETADKR